MDRLARPKDDLFDNSTMTFGEHLEELRHALVRAIIWLGIGLAVGLLFANHVVRYIQTPLRAAIREYNADRDLDSLGYDPRDESVAPLKAFLMQNALVWEVVYEIPEELQTLTQDMIVGGEAAGDTGSASIADSNVAEAATEKSGAGSSSPSATTAPNEAGPSEPVPDAPVVVKPVQIAELLSRLPDPSLLKPTVQLRKSEEGLSSLKVEEPFMIWVKAGLVVGAVLASPMILYHLWSFVAAGLHSHERRYVYIYLPVSVGLFVSGVSLAFFLVLKYVLDFLLAFNGSMEVAIEPRLTYYVNFVLMLPLGFGVAFQLPLVMLFLQRIGLVETESYVASWRMAVLIIFVLSMLLTPADVTSMVALALPLMILYFLGILMCKFIPRGRGLGSAAYDPA